jgi:hypothetical protein
MGTYNAADEDALLIVGNGDAENDRSNAFVVKKDGEAQFAGDVKVQAFGAKVISVARLKETLDALPAQKSSEANTLLCNKLS